MITDVTPILKKCGKLKELHCQANAICAIRECKVASQELKIIDLSNNKLQEEKDLAGLVDVSSLIIINILNNPLTQGTWKHSWAGTISLNNIYTMDNLYVLLSLLRSCLPMAIRKILLSASTSLQHGFEKGRLIWLHQKIPASIMSLEANRRQRQKRWQPNWKFSLQTSQSVSPRSHPSRRFQR